MAVDYIVIQAGGKGTRLKHLTKNKPKGIVPVNNLPIIFHLFFHGRHCNIMYAQRKRKLCI